MIAFSSGCLGQRLTQRSAATPLHGSPLALFGVSLT